MIKNAIVLFFFYAFNQSFLLCNQIRGWNILSDDLEMAKKTIYAAKKYRVNHLQLSHHLVHNLKEVSDPSKLSKINYLTELAHDEGISKVYVWDHALYEKKYYPRSIKQHIKRLSLCKH